MKTIPKTSDMLIAQRFCVLETAGSGGMGTVYRAEDLLTGATVALKLLHDAKLGSTAVERFHREAQVLAELRHPGIVSYVAHGITDEGRPYLAMEWLDGEDLGQRFAKQGLTPQESLILINAAAQGLTVAHRRGIVHRDLKPSNIFLRGGQVDQVALLDFGIARRLAIAPGQGTGHALAAPHTLTQMGTLVGTPDYMAPEQASGLRELSPAADIFSLGCVLFQCLTGRPPFIAEHMAALLAKILFDEAPKLRAFRKDLPEPLEAIVSRMLTKDPRQRIADAEALLGELAELQPVLLEAAPAVYQPVQTPSATQREQYLVSVIVAAPAGTFSGGNLLDGDAPMLLAPLAREGTPTLDSWPSSQGTLRSSLSRYGAEVERLLDGSLLVTIVQGVRMTATDLAAQAARCALLLHENSPTALVALATGKALVGRRRLPTGEALDRVGRMLAVAALSRGGGSTLLGGADVVLIDEVTAGLLDARFSMQSRGAEGIALIGERTSVDESRPLLGKPTPCIGREVELLQLEAVFTECRDEPMASAVVVVGQPGMGKSRLRHEFIRRLAARGDEVTLLLGRGEPMAAQTAYGVVGQALRRLCGVIDGEPLSDQQARLRQRVQLHVAAADVARVTAFLGELCGLPFAEETVAQLRPARLDPNRMSDEIRRAMLEFLSAECAARPILWVLEDLHWSDGLTVRLVDAVLRDLRERPLMVLALGRQELRDLFPKLWEGRRTQSFDLKGLSKKASEKLASQVLGSEITRETLARIVAQAEGNALFLEELIRATAEGKGENLPPTVLAMLQARLGRMVPEVRSVLRAASVFGEAFWQGGVAALLRTTGSRPRPESREGRNALTDETPERGAVVDPWLRVLLNEEVVERQTTSRFPQEIEFRFRHTLMREAAYSLLTAEDRRLEHQRAARYLKRMGEADPLILAEHYRRGGELEQTVPLYMRAGDDASRVWAMAEARQHFAAAHAALEELPKSVANSRCKIDVLLRQARGSVLSEAPELNLARLSEARALLSELEATASTTSDEETIADKRRGGFIDFLCGRIYYYQSQPAEAIACCRRVLPVAEALHDEQLLAMPSQLIGATLLTQGQGRQSRPLLARAVALQDRLDNDFERLRALCNYATNQVLCGEYRAGMALHEQSLVRAAQSKQPAGMAVAHMFLCCSRRLCGDFVGFLDSAHKVYDAAGQAGEQVQMVLAGGLIGWAHGLLGDLAEAQRYHEQTARLGRELGGRIILSDWLAAGDIELALRAGDLERAVAIGEDLVPKLRQEDRLLALGVAQQGLGLALGRGPASQRAAAEAHLGGALAVLEESDQRFGAAILRLEWAKLCALWGEPDRAAALRERGVAQFTAADCAELVSSIERLTLTKPLFEPPTRP